jgi:TolA-binding protein
MKAAVLIFVFYFTVFFAWGQNNQNWHWKDFEKDSLPEIYPMVIAEELNQYAIGNDAPIQQLNLSNLPETRGSSSQADKQTAQQLGHYFKGIAYLEKGSSQQAIINLQWVIKNSDNKQLTAKAEWYLALSYLKNDNNNEAEILLKKVSQNENNSTYSSKALRLLKSIKK